MKVCDKTCIFFFFPIINKYFLMAKRSLLSRCPSYTVELHLSGLIGTTSNPDMHKIRINGFFFENRLHWQFEVGGVGGGILRTAVSGYIFIYVQIT